ncbi:zinc finger protein 622-like [Stegodyphus dumicola]|uniref:zinc finger protein 622-like n=1 Tax=Stegodyphus dumicola TaxID=202533 RepID=UPI0015AFCE18|nr:zinc finger protein 622-like [Stegodyphus dumicola]
MSLSCISCKVVFSAPELHHEHYKTDWHRYNLKRRVAELPPLTKEEFDKRAAVFQLNAETREKKEFLRCELCNKVFSSKNTFVNHLKSKKHLEMEAGEPNRMKKSVSVVPQQAAKVVEDEKKSETCSDDEWEDDDDGDWESCDEDEEVRRIIIDTNDCLFCDNVSDSTEGNVTHMTEVHSFFIPDIEYVSDLDGLIACLAKKLHLYHICLWCSEQGRTFKSVIAAKQHMRDKGHCMMYNEGEAFMDYADYYNYESAADIDEAVSDALSGSEDFVVLPSGAEIVHRSLALYFKQNKPISPDNSQKVKRILQHYKALGYTGATGQMALKKARDIQLMRKVKSRYDLKLGMKQNKMQPHFRSQIMF